MNIPKPYLLALGACVALAGCASSKPQPCYATGAKGVAAFEAERAKDLSPGREPEQLPNSFIADACPAGQVPQAYTITPQNHTVTTFCVKPPAARKRRQRRPPPFIRFCSNCSMFPPPNPKDSGQIRLWH